MPITPCKLATPADAGFGKLRACSTKPNPGLGEKNVPRSKSKTKSLRFHDPSMLHDVGPGRPNVHVPPSGPHKWERSRFGPPKPVVSRLNATTVPGVVAENSMRASQYCPRLFE